MDVSKYKLKGVSFETQGDKTYCTLDQCGVQATYPWRDGAYKGKAKYLLMDLDGTSIQSEEFWIYMIEKTVQTVKNDPSFRLQEEDFPFVSGFTAIEHLDYCIKKFGLNVTPNEANVVYHETVEKELEALMAGDGNAEAFKPRAGLKDFLYAVKARGIKIGLVTSGMEYKAVPEIASAFRVLGLGDPTLFYDAIITGGKRKKQGEYGSIGELATKPHPWVYAEIASGLGVKDKAEVVVLEDSSAGLLAGRLAGFSVIGFNDGNILQSGLSDQAYAMVDTFDEVLKLL